MDRSGRTGDQVEQRRFQVHIRKIQTHQSQRLRYVQSVFNQRPGNSVYRFVVRHNVERVSVYRRTVNPQNSKKPRISRTCSPVLALALIS